MSKVPIISDAAYHAALCEASRLVDLDPALGSTDADRLDALVRQIQDYEAHHFPLPALDPVEAIRFRMDQQGLAPADLVPMIGALADVHDVLSGVTPLTSGMIDRLHEELGITIDSLLGRRTQARQSAEPDTDD